MSLEGFRYRTPAELEREAMEYESNAGYDDTRERYHAEIGDAKQEALWESEQEPTPQEMVFAAEWVRLHDAREAKRKAEWDTDDIPF